MAKEPKQEDFHIPHVMVGKDAQEIAKAMKAHNAALLTPTPSVAVAPLAGEGKRPQIRNAGLRAVVDSIQATPADGGAI